MYPLVLIKSLGQKTASDIIQGMLHKFIQRNISHLNKTFAFKSEKKYCKFGEKLFHCFVVEITETH